MKKMLTLTVAMTLAFVLSNVSLAEEVNAEEIEVVVAEPVVEIPAASEQPVVEGYQDCFGPAMPCRPMPCRPFLRRNCNPCFAAPCGPAPCGVAPCNAMPCRPAPCRAMHRAMPCAAPCGTPCAAPQADCGTSCDPCGYDPCGSDPCGSGYRHAPIRNFFSRIFAPRPYYGYDAYYGPTGYGYGYGPCGY